VSVPGFTIKKIFTITCELCGENIVERADEDRIRTVDDAEWYAREHRERHYQDGSWKRVGRPWNHDV
jgi:hypothetical protein